MTVKQVGAVGDSLVAGYAFAHDIAQGGPGMSTELCGERCANLYGIGPLVSSGMRFPANGIQSSREWSYTAGGDAWTTVISTDAFDVLPYGKGRYASGASKIATYTHPTHWRLPVGVQMTVVDYAGGGDWQYRIDGGTWTNHGQNLTLGSPSVRIIEFYVATPGGFTTIDFRGSNGVGSVGCFPGPISEFYLPPSTSQGFILHNYGVGAQTLHTLCTTTSGDRLKALDSIVAGTGSPLVSKPNAGTFMLHVNDYALGSVSNWGTDLTTFYNRASPLGPVGFIAPWECNNTAAANQDSYRNDATNGLHAKAAALGARAFDMFNVNQARGYGGVGAQNAIIDLAGVGLLTDGTHLSESGQLDFATFLYWFVRQELLAVSDNRSTSYPVTGKQAAVAYAGKQAAVAYSAGLPVSIG